MHTCTTMVHDSRAAGEQPVVRHGPNQQHLLLVLLGDGFGMLAPIVCMA